jgi:hypothetical protein
MGGTESEITFQVGSSVQKYSLADIVSLKFDSERAVSDQPKPSTSSLPSEPQPAEYSIVDGFLLIAWSCVCALIFVALLRGSPLDYGDLSRLQQSPQPGASSSEQV